MVMELPLGRLYGVADAWAGGWGHRKMSCVIKFVQPMPDGQVRLSADTVATATGSSSAI